MISDEVFETEKVLYTPQPKFKDALYLRRLYEKFYGQVEPKLVSKYWVPNWSGENPDSSARLLDIFNAEDENKKLINDVAGKGFKSKVGELRD